jgi:hypothetical protein
VDGRSDDAEEGPHAWAEDDANDDDDEDYQPDDDEVRSNLWLLFLVVVSGAMLTDPT